MSSISVAEGISILRSGGIIAYPTETFYGLGANARDERAIEKIFAIKGRSFKSPISILVADLDELGFWVRTLDERAKILIKNYWPGPLTLVFKAKAKVSKLLTADSGLIGLRVSSNKTARKLAGALGAITTTSANLAGQAPAKSAAAVLKKLGSKLDGVVSNEILFKRKASTVLDISTSKLKLIREGVIPLAHIEVTLKNYGSPKNPAL